MENRMTSRVSSCIFFSFFVFLKQINMTCQLKIGNKKMVNKELKSLNKLGKWVFSCFLLTLQRGSLCVVCLLRFACFFLVLHHRISSTSSFCYFLILLFPLLVIFFFSFFLVFVFTTALVSCLYLTKIEY